MNGHLEGKIWTSINIPTYPFHPTNNFKLDLFCVGFICRILNSAEYAQKVIAGERWMCGLNFGIHVYHRYYIFEPIKHNKRKYTLSIVICACKSTVKHWNFSFALKVDQQLCSTDGLATVGLAAWKKRNKRVHPVKFFIEMPRKKTFLHKIGIHPLTSFV